MRTVFVSGLFLVSVACSSGQSGIDYSDFINAVASRAGAGATVCSDEFDPNQCIADSFSNAIPAYSVFQSEGIDSQVGNGVAITRDSKVYYMNFDSDPSGGGSLNNGQITTRECVNPQSSSTGVGAFLCE